MHVFFLFCFTESPVYSRFSNNVHPFFSFLKENDISLVDCEDMKSLRVLKLSCNKLTCIHGLAGVDNLDVLELSHNSITRIGES